MTGRTHARGGFTLVELAITVAIFGILAVISVALMENFIPAWRTREAAMQFAADLNKMRMSAIKDNIQYRLEVVDWDSALTDVNVDSVGAWNLEAGNKASGSTSWDVLPVELNDVTGTADGTVVISKGGANQLPWVSLQEPTTKTVTFSPRGWCDNPVTDYTEDGGYIVFNFVNKRAAIEAGTDVWTVKVSRGGLVRVEANKNLWTTTNPVGTQDAGTPSSSPTGYLGTGS